MPTLIANNLGLIASEKAGNYVDVTAPANIPVVTLDPASLATHDDELEKPATTDPAPSKTLWEAAEQADIDTVRLYLDKSGPDNHPKELVNIQDPTTGATLLHLTITSASPTLTQKEADQRLDLMKLLLSHGADVTICNLYGVQAIHMVPLHLPTASYAFLATLLDHDGARIINAQDGDGWTPLHYAARFCQPPLQVMQLLVSHGAKVNTVATGHKSCLFGLLANGDHLDCFQWLVHTAKADIRLLGDVSTLGHRATVVLQAAKYGRLETLRYLVRQPDLVGKLKSLISLDELDQARHIIREQQPLEAEIDHLTVLLDKDPASLVAKQQRKQSRGSFIKRLRRAFGNL